MVWNMAGKSEKERMRNGEEEEKYIGPLLDRRGGRTFDLDLDFNVVPGCSSIALSQ
jgi:hypothetical protein